MHFTTNDYIGFTGVFILLVAFALNLTGRTSKDSLLYISLNVLGGALACLASYRINYVPFIILEGTWTLVSFVALIRYFTRK